MPRTKAPQKKGAGRENVKATVLRLLIKECRAQRDRDNKQLTAFRDLVIKESMQKLQFLQFQLSHPEKTIKELREMMGNSTMMRTACDNLEHSSMNSTNKNQMKKKRSLSCAADDDGYLTGDSASSRGTRTSRARSRLPLASSTTRVSRSLSRSRAQQEPPMLNTHQRYKTPVGKQPSKAYGMITPKMQPNTPQLILRRPKHGEMAVSLEGSPLMVNPVAADRIANVNIPLGEGKLLSLQPERGLRISQVPQLDAETQRQLQTLSEHIQRICAAATNRV